MTNPTQSFDPDSETPLSLEPEMILIPAGAFLMGSDPEKDATCADAPAEDIYAEHGYAIDWERPQHALYLPSYYLGRTPVTYAQYAAFLQATEHPRPKGWRGNKPPRGKDDLPVVRVSWHDATAYCGWLSESTGNRYRLPTEAEWEKAACWEAGVWAAGDVNELESDALKGRKRRYPWGDAWELGRCNTAELKENGITSVDAYPQGASPYGLLDMAGNVWEWTVSLWGVDWYKPEFIYPYDPTDGREALGASDRVCRVLRGGSFAYPKSFARPTFRYKNFPQSYSDGIGFRVALSPSTP
jgi:formylglycine-generating enzyme required for sulfatase activity